MSKRSTGINCGTRKTSGNYVSTNISDRNIIAYVCDLYQRSNLLISNFRVCDRTIMRRIWRLPSSAHNAIVQNLSYNIDISWKPE